MTAIKDMDYVEKFEEVTDTLGLTNFEGEFGVYRLCKLVELFGYKDDLHRMQLSNGACVGSLLLFLGDNPGAIESMLDWVQENQLFEEELNEELEVLRDDSTDDGEER